MVSDLLRAWTDADLHYELTKQQAAGIHTWGIGACGHPARGSGVCASCLTAELDRRQALTGEAGRNA